MALAQVKTILLRIATDPDFRYQFLSKREAALKKYQDYLTEEERQCLMELPSDEEELVEKVADKVVTVTCVSDIRI